MLCWRPKIGNLHGLVPVGVKRNDLKCQTSVPFLPRVNANAGPELRRIPKEDAERRVNDERICASGERVYVSRFATYSKLVPGQNCRGFVLRHVSLLFFANCESSSGPASIPARFDLGMLV